MVDIRPVVLDVPEDHLDDLRRRLATTRWTDDGPDPSVGQGPATARLRALAEHWRTRHDW